MHYSQRFLWNLFGMSQQENVQQNLFEGNQGKGCGAGDGVNESTNKNVRHWSCDDQAFTGTSALVSLRARKTKSPPPKIDWLKTSTSPLFSRLYME